MFQVCADLVGYNNTVVKAKNRTCTHVTVAAPMPSFVGLYPDGMTIKPLLPGFFWGVWEGCCAVAVLRCKALPSRALRGALPRRCSIKPFVSAGFGLCLGGAGSTFGAAPSAPSACAQAAARIRNFLTECGDVAGTPPEGHYMDAHSGCKLSFR